MSDGKMTMTDAGAAWKTSPALLQGAALLLILASAGAFFVYYVPHYILQYDAKSYDVYWARRFALLPHLLGGTLALFIGPFQFWTGLRRRWPRVHRWSGRLFLAGVAIGICGAVYLAVTTTYGWAYGVGLMGLAVAWTGTTAIAYLAIRNGDRQTHQRWMIRAYAVTFAFVTGRALDDWLPTSQLQPLNVRVVNDIWLSWTVPLFAVILIQALADLRSRQPRRAA
jgi:hypothetical protein